MRVEYISAGARPELPVLLMFDITKDNILNFKAILGHILRGVVGELNLEAQLNNYQSLGECKIKIVRQDETCKFERKLPKYEFIYTLSIENIKDIVEQLNTFAENFSKNSHINIAPKGSLPFILSTNKDMDW